MSHDDTERLVLGAKDDYERTIRFSIRDGGVLRLNWATFKTQYYTLPGGMQEYRTDAVTEDAALKIAAMYPDRISSVRRRGFRQQVEVRLRRGSALCEPIPAPHHLLH